MPLKKNSQTKQPELFTAVTEIEPPEFVEPYDLEWEKKTDTTKVVNHFTGKVIGVYREQAHASAHCGMMNFYARIAYRKRCGTWRKSSAR
jgi:hypothetical protein